MSSEAPTGDVQDNEYVSRQGDREPIGVLGDDAKVEDPIDAETANSDAQLGKSMLHLVECRMSI